MLKNTFIVLVLSLPFLGYSDDTTDCGQCVYPLLPPEPVESCQLPVGYFYPAQHSFQNCCMDISVGGEFLYWEVNQDDVPQIGTKFDFDNDGTTILTILAHQQEYRPGFKVAVGMGFPGFDNWSFDAEYTWFHHTTTNNFIASDTGFITTKFLPQLFFMPSSSLRSRLKLNLDFCQATVGRAFFLSQRLIVKAGVGIKSWWASQELDLFFDVIGAPQATEFTKSGLWGVGPYVTAHIQALLWCGTYIFGKAGVWTTYTRLNKYRVATNYPTVGVVNDQTNRSQPYDTGLFYDGGAGIGWGTYFCDCGYHVDFSVGYDMMTNFISPFIISLGLPIKAFYYQGFSVKAQLDF